MLCQQAWNRNNQNDRDTRRRRGGGQNIQMRGGSKQEIIQFAYCICPSTGILCRIAAWERGLNEALASGPQYTQGTHFQRPPLQRQEVVGYGL